MTSTATQARTRLCKDCRTRKEYDGFPADKHGRVDARMCLQCVDENTPLLMTEGEMAKWLGVPIAAVREFPAAGSYSPPKGLPVALYNRPAVTSNYLPAG